MARIVFGRTLSSGGFLHDLEHLHAGHTATALNCHSGPQTIEEGAVTLVRLAQLPEDGPNASFIHKDGTYPW